MRQEQDSNSRQHIPGDAVLLIPEPESPGEKPPYSIKPGYYTRHEMLQLLERHKDDADAIHFIADMLETGDPAADGFVELLRANCAKPGAIASIIRSSSSD